jgi:hypothetical protein
MGRARKLSQQLLNEPFNEVKTRVVRFRVVGWMRLRNLLPCRQMVQLHDH